MPGILQAALFEGDASGQQMQVGRGCAAQRLVGMLARLLEDVLQHAALGQPQVGQFPVPARQGSVQRAASRRRGAGEAAEGGLDALVDPAFLLVEHRVGQQADVVGRVAQGQLEDRDRFLAGHPPGGEDRREPLVRVRRMAQDVLQAAVAEHHVEALFLRPERQLGDAHRLPGLLATLARQVQRREYRRSDADRSDQRHEEGQAEEEQRAPRQRELVAPRQQQPYADAQQRAAQAVGEQVERQRLAERQVGEDARPTAQLEQEGAAKQPLADHSSRTR